MEVSRVSGLAAFPHCRSAKVNYATCSRHPQTGDRICSRARNGTAWETGEGEGESRLPGLISGSSRGYKLANDQIVHNRVHSTGKTNHTPRGLIRLTYDFLPVG